MRELGRSSGVRPSGLIVGHAALGQIPFALLPTRPVVRGVEREPIFAGYRAVPWLIRRHAVTVILSATALTTLRAQPPANPARRPFVGFGDFYFSAAQARTAADRGGTVEVAAVTRGVTMTFRSAPKTRDVFTGVRANERTVKTLDLSRCRMIAFGTHGLMAGDLDGLTQPALALTAPAVANVDGDGLLTMEEILGLRLDADRADHRPVPPSERRSRGAERPAVR